MIKAALDILKTQLDTYLKSVLGPNSYVEVSNLVTPSGEPVSFSDKIVITLFSIDEERTLKSQGFTKSINGTTQIVNPDLKLNLFILVSANFSEYEVGLGALSNAITFFQGKSVFNHQNTPELDAAIDVLYLDFINHSEDEQYDVWNKIGAKYQPSVIYRVRMLTIQANFALENRVDIETMKVNVNQLN